MELILDFLVDNYLWFLIISLILVFGLIGYVVDTKEKKTPKLHFGNDEDLNSETPEEAKSLDELLEETENLEETEVLVENPVMEPVSNEVNMTASEPIDNIQENNQNELPKE